MTQKSLILAWIDEFGRIMPAKMSGEVWKHEMFGSETSKRCRELRKCGILTSKPEGKFEVFYRTDPNAKPQEQIDYEAGRNNLKDSPQLQQPLLYVRPTIDL